MFVSSQIRYSSFLPDAESDRGNSVRGAEGWGIKKVQVLYCIRVLRSVTSSGDESVNQDLCDQGIINQLLGRSQSGIINVSIATPILEMVSTYSCFFLGGGFFRDFDADGSKSR